MENIEEKNEDFAAEQVAENVEQTTEQTPVKTYTQEEVDAMMGKRVARTEAKIRKEYDRKYGRMAELVKAGTGKQSVEEANDLLEKHYGAKVPQKPQYSPRETEILAEAEANEIIRGGLEDVVEEVDRLTALGAENMTPKEKAVFRVLAAHRQSAERDRELAQMGVPEDVYSSKEFRDFAGKFNPNTPLKDIVEIYEGLKPKKNIKPMGSMKQTPSTGAKDYYTPEEIERLTEEDLDDPKVWEAVRRSMTGQ